MKKISKFMSLVLRHQPDAAGVEMDSNGWVEVEALLRGLNQRFGNISMEVLEVVVETNEKKRFIFNADKSLIRANQGHTVEVDLELPACDPPDVLLHGTAERFLDAILNEGLKKMNRHHVHLSECEKTASQVGNRYGKLVLLEVDAAGMQRDGRLFYRSENGVWLTESVPSEYIKLKK